MKVLLAIVHYWDPQGNRRHQSLRADPGPRVEALKQQILSLRRLASQQYQMHMGAQSIFRTNADHRLKIDLHLVTDGEHTVLEHLEPDFRACIEEVVTQPETGLMLPFEAHRHLGEVMSREADHGYDLYGYMEDDLVIHDPLFFRKIQWFQEFVGEDEVLLPQRVEFSRRPHVVDKLFIDGPLSSDDQDRLPLRRGGPLLMQVPGGDVVFETPENPHAGCFFLSSKQLSYWMEQSHWLDFDSGFISPLESGATLGLMKTFQLRKPSFLNASWLEVQHWGTSFHNLIRLPEVEEVQE